MLSSLLSHLARLCLSTGLINRRGRHRDWQQQIRPCAITATALLLQDATATTSPLLGDILVPTDLCKEPARTLCVGQAPLTLSGYQGKIIMGFAIHPAHQHITSGKGSSGPCSIWAFPGTSCPTPLQPHSVGTAAASRTALQMLGISTAPSAQKRQ